MMDPNIGVCSFGGMGIYDGNKEVREVSSSNKNKKTIIQ